MERKAYQVVFPVTFVVVMVAFLSGIFMTNPSLSYAASAKHKSSGVTRSNVESTEGRIIQLKGALKITEDQEPLWNNVTQVMRENARNMDALTKDRAEKAKTMNAVERMKFHSEITEAQLEQQKKFIPPFEALYNSMSEVQMAVTDAIFKTGKHGKHKI